MKKMLEAGSIQSYFLSTLFFFYYIGIAIICSANWQPIIGFDITSLFENKFLIFYSYVSISSGCLLFISTIPSVEVPLRWYWHNRDVAGGLRVLLYLIQQSVLLFFPYWLAVNGYWLRANLSTPIFFLSTFIVLVALTYSRFNEPGTTDITNYVTSSKAGISLVNLLKCCFREGSFPSRGLNETQRYSK